jgi:hypothetical protein
MQVSDTQLTRRDVVKFAGAAANGLSAATLAGCASTAPASCEPSSAPTPRTSTASPGLARSTTVATARPPIALAALALAFAFLLPGTAAPGGVPRVLVVGPLESYGGLVAGISEGLQAAGFRDAAQIRLDARNIRSIDDAKAAVAAAVTEGVDVIVTVFGQAT